MSLSLWLAENKTSPEYKSIDEGLSVDVAIIGGGIMGLSTARHLAMAGVRVCVLEAADIGWGASGRNNGQVIPGLKRDPDEVIHKLGPYLGGRLIDFSGRAPDYVFSLIEQYKIDCDAVRNGWIQAFPDQASRRLGENRIDQWRKRGAPVDMIARDKLKSRLGTEWYAGAGIDMRGGAVNPLAYTRGLATAAVTEGALIYTNTPVQNMNRSGAIWMLSTPNGKILAGKVIICTNAYRDIMRDKARTSIIPVRTAQIATQPLPENQWRSILPGGEVASDSCHLLTSFRITPDKRLIMGGADATGGGEHSGLSASLVKAASVRFPQLGDVDVAYSWSGYLGITKDHLPRIFNLGDGILAPIGCNGRGIAMATTSGEVVADLAMGLSQDNSPIPVSGPRPFFFHRFRNVGIAAHVQLSRFRSCFL